MSRFFTSAEIVNTDGTRMAETHYGAFEPVWWDMPATPSSRVPASAYVECIPQIDEPVGGIQSCGLTAVLNAWVVRQYLTAEQAEHVQTTAATEPAFARYWADQRSHNGYYAWGGRAYDAAHVVKRILRKRMPIGLTFDSNIPTVLAEGHAVVLSDGEHARVAYQPELDGDVVVCDTKYTQLNGRYGVDEIMNLERQMPDGKRLPMFVRRRSAVKVV